MKVLLVSATLIEIAPVLSRLGHPVPPGERLGVAGMCIHTDRCDVLITGVGQLQCAVHVTNALAAEAYDVVVHAGIAGSFTPTYGKRAVVMVEEECLADLGAETGGEANVEAGGGWTDIGDMGLLPPDQPPFTEGRLRASRAWAPTALDLPFARSATVNRVLGEPRSIDWVRSRYSPDIVNMEGAALFHACLVRNVPFVALRAISDMVGSADRATWDVPGAIEALNGPLWTCLEAFASRLGLAHAD